MLDITDEKKPFPVAVWQVPVGDYCKKGGRFGPHQSADTVNGQINRFTDKLAWIAYFNAGVRVVDLADPLRPTEVGYYVPKATALTHPMVMGQPAVTQMNDVDIDHRGLAYASDRAGTGLVHPAVHRHPLTDSAARPAVAIDRAYLLSLPERLVRSVVALGAGVTREVGEVALPDAVRQGQLYQNLVESTLRFLIERVGGAEGVYDAEARLPDDFLVRRTAGNALEVLGLVAFRASPVWILAALSDLCGLGRHLIPQIAEALKAQKLLDPEATFESVDQLLDGLERTTSRMASTVNTPPLDVAGLRQEWHAIRQESRALTPQSLPSGEAVTGLWERLRTEAARQQMSVFGASSMMAVSAVRSVPDHVRWLSTSTTVGAGRAGSVMAGALLDHYRRTLDEARAAGFTAYANAQLGPYIRAAAAQFSPDRRTLTESLLGPGRPLASHRLEPHASYSVAPMDGGAFISYRREDAAGFAGRLCDSLERLLPNEPIFRDVDGLSPGQDFVDGHRRAAPAVPRLPGRHRPRLAERARRRGPAPPGPARRLRAAGADGGAGATRSAGHSRAGRGGVDAAGRRPASEIRALARRQAVALRDDTWDSRRGAPGAVASNQPWRASHGRAAGGVAVPGGLAHRRRRWWALVVLAARRQCPALRRRARATTPPVRPRRLRRRSRAVARRRSRPRRRRPASRARASWRFQRVSQVGSRGLVYTLMSARLEPGGSSDTLRLRVALENDSRRRRQLLGRHCSAWSWTATCCRPTAA